MTEDLLLASDSLASFLRELDDLEGPLAPPPVSLHDCDHGGGSLDSPASLSGAVQPPPKTKRRRTSVPNGHTVTARSSKRRHTECMKKLRGEIHALYQQLQRLQHDPSRGGSWKQRAACERLARGQAEYENAHLKQRLGEGSKLCHEVKRLLSKQQESLPSARDKIAYSLVDDDGRVFRMLQNDLSKRQHQLEISMRMRVSEITQRNLLGQFRQDKWDVVAHDSRLQMDVVESVLLPFNASMVNAAICQYTQSGATPQAAGVNVVDRVIWGASAKEQGPPVALGRGSGGRQLQSRSILRRIRNEFGMILLWEALSYWQSTDASEKSPLAIVCESGWSIIASVGDGADDLSIGHCVKSFRIQSSDGSSMEKRDPLVRQIVQTCQESHDIQSRRMGNTVMDRSIAHQKQKSVKC